VTQDDLLYRFRPRVFAIAAELGTVRAACRAMGIHPSTYYRWKRQLDRHGPEILAQSPCRNVPLPKIEREEMPFSPPPRSSTWPRRSTPASGHWCSSAPTPACGSDSWPGYARAEPTCWPGRSPWPRSSPRSRQTNRRPPKTRAGRRTVGLPPFVVHELEAHLAAAQRPSNHVFTAPRWGHCGSRAFGRVLGCRLPTQPACASTIFATRPWRCGSPPARRPRRSPCAGHTSVSFTLDRYGHQTIPWPVAEGRCHPVRD
jgi:hypothetical protein